jgi:uncharacterized protein (TIGR02147 family)
MARDFGFTSPNFLKLVMDGDRNLSSESLAKVLNGLGLPKRASSYFSYLVYFCQAHDTVQKNYYFGLLAAFRTRSIVARINADQYDYYTEWYACVIRELVAGTSAEDLDYAALAAQVRPAISARQAKKAVRLLERIGMIERDEEGRFRHSSRLVATDREMTSLAVRNYHKKMIQIAQESIEEVEREEREISSLTIHVSPQGFNRIKQRIQDFKEELMQIVHQDTDVDTVYQVNFQLFPVSRKQRGR